MASSAAGASSSTLFRVFPAPASSHSNGRIQSPSRLFLGTSKPSLFLPPILQSRPFLSFYRSKRNVASAATSKKSKKLLQDDYGEEDDLDGDALEKLFNQLEEDLKNDGLSTNDNDDDISEEDMVRLEQELEEAFGDGSEDEISGTVHSNMENVESYDDDSDDEVERPLKLRTWQLRRLASALKIGRRKTSIKNLAGELGLDRAVVLELLRDPPPDLLLMCASLPDTVVQTSSGPKSEPLGALPVELTESKPLEASHVTMTESKHVEPVMLNAVKPIMLNVARPNAVVKEPIHVQRKRWSMQKRLTKVQLETLEKVYSRTKRPTNSMICSVVHVTRVPWKKVVKWFEDRRQEDGIPEKRLPYRRPMRKTVSAD